MIRVASDVGGTFTDVAWCEVDPSTGTAGPVHGAKVDTTPPDFERGVLDSLTKAGIEGADVAFLAHGSTVVINALTERKGVATSLLTTAGFRDVLEIARGNRPDLFNFNFRKPPPFVERHLRREARERTNVKGEIVTDLVEADVDAAATYFRDQGVAAVAVCFLHGYANSANEQAAAERLRTLLPGVSVIASHEISREWREYERTSTTVLSAYVAPVVDRYVAALGDGLAARGVPQPPFMMQSNGGVASAADARANPVSMVESGPAAGILAAAAVGRSIGLRDLLVLDIGGTTAKCALIENGIVKVSTEYHIERDRKRPGYPIQTPVSEIVEIGNGGGSIAWVDDGGKLHVGPRSAGARPGPAAYGLGGTAPTTTDANLLLGRIDPASFAGGEREPDWSAVHAAFARLGGTLGIGAAELARAIVRVANANMVNALRLVSTNKGHDPRDFTLMAFGGGGAMHAAALARELGIAQVVVPANSAVFSAYGMLLSDLRRDYIQTRLTVAKPGGEAVIMEEFAALEARAAAGFSGAGGGAPECEWLADMRYAGQEHTVKVPVVRNDGAVDLATTVERFHAAHEKLYTFRLATAPVQIVNYHLVATVPVTRPAMAERPATGGSLDAATLGRRRVDYDQDGVHNALIVDGAQLDVGVVVPGPAIVQEPSATLVVPPGHCVELDRFGNYHLQTAQGGDA
jgi:N-methylhydantoinase A